VYAQRSRSYRPVAFEVTDGRTKWVADGTGSVLGPPAASDGIVVYNDGDGSLLGLDTETGERAWTRSVGNGVRGAVAIADGTVYFNEPNGPLYALTAE
jgi:outer membrane protein assembly factor BamB